MYRLNVEESLQRVGVVAVVWREEVHVVVGAIPLVARGEARLREKQRQRHTRRRQQRRRKICEAVGRAKGKAVSESVYLGWLAVS